MNYKKSILTSKFDLAFDVCGDIAYYFDPLDVNSILNSMSELVNNPKLIS